MNDLNQTLTEHFNSKVVKMDEFRSRLKKLYKSELSLFERLRVHSSKPLSALVGIKIGYQLVFRTDIKRPLKEKTWDGSIGLYYDSDKKSYMHQATIETMYNLSPKFMRRSAHSRKVWKLSQKAISQCKDYQKDVQSRELRAPRTI